MGDFFDLSGFGDLANFGGVSGGELGLDMPAPAPAPSSGFSGFSFGDIASGVGDAARSFAGGIKDVLQPVGQIAGAVAPLAQLGTAGMGIASGIQGAKTAASNAATGRRAQKLQEQVAGQQAAAAQPLTEFGKKQLDASSAGQVPPAEEARIQNWLQGAIQHAQDYAARSGQGNSLMLTQWVNWLNKQADEMRAAAIGEQQRLGITGLAAGANALGGAGQTAGNIQTGAQNQSGAIAALMAEANRALASLTAGASA